MPKYSFSCKLCNLHFDRFLKIGDHAQHPCPACTEQAERVWDSFGYGFEFTDKSEKANTGVHAHDYPTADQGVGQRAERLWGRFEERQKVKNKIRQESGTEALMRTSLKSGVVDYKPMGTSQVQARRKLTREYLEIKNQKPQDTTK